MWKSVASIIFVFVVSGCTTILPERIVPEQRELPERFSHQKFDCVLKDYVDEQGLVHYASLLRNRKQLDAYFALLSAASPRSHPQLFPTSESRLAYWINAYNASAIKIVLKYYPISSVLDVKPPPILFFMPDVSGFFLFHRVSIGADKMSLYSLENKIIRKGFSDPRIHFALNCASAGCPRLPRAAFSEDDLSNQLDRETRAFLSESRNLHIDHENKTIRLSSIFKWYENDFLDWVKNPEPPREKTLIDFIVLYVPQEKASELKELSPSYDIAFIPYDWKLNDQENREILDKQDEQDSI